MKDTNVNSFYTVITGFFEYDISKIDEGDLFGEFVDWRKRINFNKDDYPYNQDGGFLSFIEKAYYQGFKDNMFSEADMKRNILLKGKLNHLTQKNILNKRQQFVIEKGQNILQVSVDFFDLYLFPEGVGLFSIKLTLLSSMNLFNISDLLIKVRDVNCKLRTNLAEEREEANLPEGVNSTLIDIINSYLRPLHVSRNALKRFNPKFKTFSIIDVKGDLDSKIKDSLLVDLGNLLPIGTTFNKKSHFRLSDDYVNDQLNNNKISIFETWTALALFDTFTVITENSDDLIFWEPENFLTYIHALHIKFYMYLSNEKISVVTKISKETKRLKDSFIEFINDYYHTNISYNFLPDVLYHKIIFALEVDDELKEMERKIKRLNETVIEKSESKIQVILFIIAALSIFSSVHDFSEWMFNVENSSTVGFYRSMSGLFFVLFLSIGVVVYKKMR